MEDGWAPTVLGLSKRDLARDVLTVFGTPLIFCLLEGCLSLSVARSKTLYKLALDYQELLKKTAGLDD